MLVPTSSSLEERIKQIDACLDQIVPDSDAPEASLYRAARYSLLAGGKRLRPLLTLAVTECLGGSVETALHPACALELVHCYSLIHDDLPCMDDDDFRRQKPTLHRATSEAHAILAGDFLHTQSFRILAQAEGLSSSQRLELVDVLSSACGGQGMVAGQILDMESEGKDIDLERLQLIHSKKTGALLRASVEFGGIITPTSQELRENLQNFGELIGIAFQIIDDILDVTDIQAKRGGSSVSDIVNDKTTYPKLIGIDKAKIHANRALEQAKNLLNQFPGDTSELHFITDLVGSRSH